MRSSSAFQRARTSSSSSTSGLLRRADAGRAFGVAHRGTWLGRVGPREPARDLARGVPAPRAADEACPPRALEAGRDTATACCFGAASCDTRADAGAGLADRGPRERDRGAGEAARAEELPNPFGALLMRVLRRGCAGCPGSCWRRAAGAAVGGLAGRLRAGAAGDGGRLLFLAAADWRCAEVGWRRAAAGLRLRRLLLLRGCAALGLPPALCGEGATVVSSLPFNVDICASLAASCWRSDSSCESSDEADDDAPAPSAGDEAAAAAVAVGGERAAFSASYIPLKRSSSASAFACASAAACAVRDAIGGVLLLLRVLRPRRSSRELCGDPCTCTSDVGVHSLSASGFCPFDFVRRNCVLDKNQESSKHVGDGSREHAGVRTNSDMLT